MDKAVQLSVRLSHTLQFVLLFDGITVGASLSGIDQLITETLSDRLDVPESRLARTSAKQPDGLIHAPQRRHIYGLAPDCTSASNPSGILARPRVDNRVNDNLEGVLSREQVDYLEAVLHDSHGHQLLAVVSTVHHQGVDQSLNNGALGLTGSLSRIPASRVRKILGVLLLDSNVVLERHIRHLDVLTGPLSEQLDLRLLSLHHRNLIVIPIVGHPDCYDFS